MTEQDTTDLAASVESEDAGMDATEDSASGDLAPLAAPAEDRSPSPAEGDQGDVAREAGDVEGPSAAGPMADDLDDSADADGADSADEGSDDSADSADADSADTADEGSDDSADEGTGETAAALDPEPGDTAGPDPRSSGETPQSDESGESSPTPAEPVDSPWTRPGKWYVLHTQSGYENKVSENLKARTTSMNMEHRIYEVVIPMEDVVEYKQGKKVVVQKKMFPGYLLVRCRLDDDSWYVIRNTPGVTGFVGAGNKPSPLPKRDVETFLAVKSDDEAQAPKRQRPRLAFDLNETVRVKEGPFADFSGEIVEINEDQLKLKVLVDIFGRETPVELEFSQVAKL